MMMVRQRGFTLIELMISIVLSMLIAIALLTLLANVNRNNAELARTNSVIENGRFSLQLLESDLSHSGFWGGYMPQYDDNTLSTAPTDFPTDVPDPCASGSAAAWSTAYKSQLIAIPVQVYQVPTSGTSPICSTAITNAQPNTDVVVVRHAAPCAATTTAADADCTATDGQLYVQISRCPSADAANYALGVLDSSYANLPLHTGNCTGVSPIYKFLSTIYWVRKYFVSTGDGIPTLMRTRFSLDSSGNAVFTSTDALVDGVEVLRVQLGVDSKSKPTTSGGSGVTLTSASFTVAPTFAATTNTYTPTNRGDGAADVYYTCAGTSNCYDSTDPGGTAFRLANTVAIKLFVLARASSSTPGYSDAKVYCLAGTCTAPTSSVTCSPSASPTPDKLTTFGPYCDQYKRHVYTQTVRMMNISMRREVPNSW